MTPDQIAETLINGNISDARRAIVNGRTQQEAAVCTLDVLQALRDDFSLSPNGAMEMLRRCLRGGS